MRQPTPSALHSLVAAVPVEALRELVLELLQTAPATATAKGRPGWPKGKPRSPPVAAGPKARAIAAVTAHPEKSNRAIADQIGVSVQTVMRARAEAAPGSSARKKRRGKPGRRGPGRPRKEIDPGLDAKILARRKREAELQRAKKAAAKQAEASGKPGNGAAATVDPKLLARRQRAVAYQRKKRAAAKLALAGGGHGNGAGTDASGTKSPASRTPTQAFWQHAEMLQPTAPYKAVASEFGLNPAQTKDCYRKAILPPGMTAGAVERFLTVSAAT